jgi:hypothetical protein
MLANTAMTRAPQASLAVTAAVGLQPVSINVFARGPDMPNAKADATANSNPSRKWSTAGFVVALTWHLLQCNE